MTLLERTGRPLPLPPGRVRIDCRRWPPIYFVVFLSRFSILNTAVRLAVTPNAGVSPSGLGLETSKE